jgi:rRNA-processing protein FCF1
LKQVIFDSSFLMAVVEAPTTWFEDIVDDIGKFEPILPECVRRELENMASGQAKRSRTARVCLDMASGFKSVPCGQADVDDEIVSSALSIGALVATTDSKLAGSARAAHLKVISLRSRRVRVD